jgi:hypothetical protein
MLITKAFTILLFPCVLSAGCAASPRTFFSSRGSFAPFLPARPRTVRYSVRRSGTCLGPL